jgi:hypothetical protein
MAPDPAIFPNTPQEDMAVVIKKVKKKKLKILFINFSLKNAVL